MRRDRMIIVGGFVAGVLTGVAAGVAGVAWALANPDKGKNCI